MKRGFVFPITPSVSLQQRQQEQMNFVQHRRCTFCSGKSNLNHKYTKARFSSLEDLAAHRERTKKSNLEAHVTRKRKDKNNAHSGNMQRDKARKTTIK